MALGKIATTTTTTTTTSELSGSLEGNSSSDLDQLPIDQAIVKQTATST